MSCSPGISSTFRKGPRWPSTNGPTRQMVSDTAFVTGAQTLPSPKVKAGLPGYPLDPTQLFRSFPHFRDQCTPQISPSRGVAVKQRMQLAKGPGTIIPGPLFARQRTKSFPGTAYVLIRAEPLTSTTPTSAGSGNASQKT